MDTSRRASHIHEGLGLDRAPRNAGPASRSTSAWPDPSARRALGAGGAHNLADAAGEDPRDIMPATERPVVRASVRKCRSKHLRVPSKHACVDGGNLRHVRAWRCHPLRPGPPASYAWSHPVSVGLGRDLDAVLPRLGPDELSRPE